jgi:hypothetical protein
MTSDLQADLDAIADEIDVLAEIVQHRPGRPQMSSDAHTLAMKVRYLLEDRDLDCAPTLSDIDARNLGIAFAAADSRDQAQLLDGIGVGIASRQDFRWEDQAAWIVPDLHKSTVEVFRTLVEMADAREEATR